MTEDLTTTGEWQNLLDEAFPEGCLVTKVLYSEASAYTDESPQVLISTFRVLEVTNEVPTVSMKFAGMQRDQIIEVEKMEERDFGFYVITSETKSPNYLFSKNISDTQRQIIKSEREDGVDAS